MKKTLILTGAIVSTFLITGCGEALGKLMWKTGLTPDITPVYKQKAVEERLKNINAHTIVKTNFKPIPKDKVVVYMQKDVPKNCQELGWIYIDDPKAFKKDQYKDYETEAIKEKAAKLGINAVNIGGGIFSGAENLIKYTGPYKWIQYNVMKNRIVATAYEYKQRCSKEAEKKCKIKANGDKNKYYDCLMTCSYKEGHKMTYKPLNMLWVKALMCKEK